MAAIPIHAVTRVAIIGSRGQLGTDLLAVLRAVGGYEPVALTRDDIDVTNPVSVSRAIAAARPGVVVNCAAVVRVDACEDQPDEAFRVNALGALHVARACAEHDALCVYIGTDYVFDGEKGTPYAEDDPPRPINIYGASKLAGEHLVEQACRRWLIVRIASLFGKAGARGKNGNFVDLIVRKALRNETTQVVSDIRMSPTYAHDAARMLESLLRHNATGLVHLTNAGSCTWYEFARTALDLLRTSGRLEPVPSREYPMKAARPRDSSMISRRLSQLTSGSMRPWQAALRDYLAERSFD